MSVLTDVLPAQVLVLAVVLGGLYGVLALGFVITYRASRVLNMAHGDLGAGASLVVVFLTSRWGLGFWPAFLTALAVGVVVALIVEVGVIDRLREAPRLVVLVATIGVAQLLVALTSLVISPVEQGRLASGRFPSPFAIEWHLGSATITGSTLLAALVVPAIGVGLALFFRMSRFGIAMRAAAENADNARLLGVSTRRMSLVAWGIAGGLSATAAVLYAGSSGVALNLGVGPALLLRGLAAAMLARMTDLPRALGWGLGIGFMEQVLLFNVGQGGVVEAALLSIVLGALLVQRRAIGRVGRLDDSSWPVTQTLQRLPRELRSSLPASRLRLSFAAATVGLVIVLPFALSAGQTFAVTTGVAFAMCGLSLTILTGHVGQVSLGQWAVAGAGAFAAARVDATLGWSPWAAFLVAVGAGAAASLVIGLPALRVRGLFLSVCTLAFAVAASAYLFRTEWLAGGRGGLEVSRPWPVAGDRAFFYLAVAALAGAALVAHRTKGGRLGRNLMAVRENEPGAAALGVGSVGAKLTGFAIAGGLAGCAGAIFLYAQQGVSGESFRVEQSLLLVVAVVIGGVGSLAGPIVGAFLLFVLPVLSPGQAFLATVGSAAGLLLVVQHLPGGLVTLGYRIRDAILGYRRPDAHVGLRSDPSPRALETAPSSPRRDRRVKHEDHPPALRADHVTVVFGGLVAVDDVCVDVAPGELVGLIGPNGAGKTTLFEVLSGFVPPSAGRVLLDGRDVTDLPAYRRAHLGLARGFQDARLFPGMAVEDVLRVSFEPRLLARTDAAGELLGLPSARRAEHWVTELARTELRRFGLEGFREAPVAELSTGMRRILELAAVLANAPRILLLDEPTAGISQAETQALANLLRQVHGQTGVTMLLIEHDIPTVLSLADRVYVMESGRLVAQGTPTQIRRDPAVAAAYLGEPARGQTVRSR